MADNKSYWIKLNSRRFEPGGDMDFLMSQKNGSQYCMLYQYLCYNTLNTNGELVTKFGEAIIPYDIDKIVRDCKYFSRDTVIVALKFFQEMGLVYEKDDGILRIANFENVIGSESASAQKVRDWRKKQRELKENIEKTMLPDCNDSAIEEVTSELHCNRSVTADVAENVITEDFKEKKNQKEKSLCVFEKEKTEKKKNPQVTNWLQCNLDTQKLTAENIQGELESRFPSEDISEALKAVMGFVEMRKGGKIKFTPRAMILNLNKAYKYADGDIHTFAEIFDQSVARGWTGVFPLKADLSAGSKDHSGSFKVTNVEEA